MQKLSVIIPVYNEISSLEKIIKKVEDTKLPIEKEIIIIDDCSSDGTTELVDSLKNKYKVVLHKENRGKGAAIKSGLEVATGDYVVIQDGDLEYDPDDFIPMLDCIKNTGNKVIYGSRNLRINPRSNNAYYYGGKFITAICNMLFGSKLTDVNTCYKMIETDLLRSLRLEQKRFSFCEEVTSKLLSRGIDIKEIPINYYPRNFKEGKKIRYYDGLQAIVTLIKYKFFSKS